VNEVEINAVFLAVALLMAFFSTYLIYAVKRGTRGVGFLLVLYLSGSMVIMFLTLAFFFSTQSKVTEAVAFLANSLYMILGLFVILTLAQRKVEVRNSYTVALFAFTMAVSEALMGETFYAIDTKTLGNPLLGVENLYYLLTMLIEMGFAVFISFRNMTTPLKYYLLVLLPIMGLSPATFPDNTPFIYDVTWASTSLMIVATILIYETLYRDRLKATQDTMTSLELMVIFTLMMGGEFLYFLVGSWYLFDLASILGMTWAIYRAIEGPSKIRGNYLRDTWWTFAFISLTFVMEWFMGGVLDFVTGVIQPGVSGFLSSLSLGFVSPSAYFGLGALFDFVSAFSTVTGSVWFLVMMGTEMGALAIMRIPQLKNKENKVRFALMISAYAIYTIYLPSFSPWVSKLPYIPYMWSMGLGTMGPVSPSYLLTGIIGTYVVSAVLSFLFGSRQICSVTCSAPLMYQGTFYDSLKTYNRKSRLGRKTLTSRLRPWYKAIVIGVWAVLLISAVLSYLTQVGVTNVTIFGVDTTVFLYTLFFNLLWYVVFISIPFMGTYACATQGWCSWGTFNQFFGSLGFFKLKVRDPSVCLKCETKACANACPVGLTDMAGSFIRKGEFKSMKCVGVGDCVEACPYDNVFFYDVRHKLRDIFHKRG